MMELAGTIHFGFSVFMVVAGVYWIARCFFPTK